jgi:hypothetical protein
MGRSNRFADMYEVYTHTETARKEQPAIRLRHMGRGPNDCRRQPRLQFAVAEGKTKAETRQYKEDQFRALEDRCEASPTQISNLYRHNEYGSRNPSAERRTHGRQHHAQAHATRWVDGFKLDFPEFPGVLQPSEFWYWTLAVEEFFKVNGVGDPQRVPLVALTFRGVVASWWQHLKQQRMRQGKRKIRSWVQLLKKLLDYFVPKSYTMDRRQRNWSQGSTAMTKNIENSYKSRETWSDAKSLRQGNWVRTCQPQIYTPNPYSVEEEKEFVDGEFQEFEVTDEEFEHECVEDEDTSQGFVDWDSPPTYDEDVDEEDSIEEPLASVIEEEHEEDKFFPMFGGLYPNEDNQLGHEEPTDDIDEYEEVDEGLSGDVSNYNEEEVEYIDFLGVEDILDSPNNDVDEFYTDEENYMFIREVSTDPFFSIFMARGREKEQKRYGKLEELTSSVLGFHDRHRSMLKMGSVRLILGCCLVLIVRKVEWDELTGHPKDRGKDRPNSRTNSLQQGENDADCVAVSLFNFPFRIRIGFSLFH